MNRAYLKDRAKAAFKNNYWMCVLVAFITGIVAGGSSGGTSGFSSNTQQYQNGDIDSSVLIAILIAVLIAMLIGIALSIFVFNPLLVGCRRFFALNSLTKAEIKEVGFVFKSGSYGNVVKTMFLKNLFIFLWSLLFIIPGIIKSYEYYMIDYLLTENPGMDYKEAFERSKQMMDGNKFDTFILELSFIGWALLSVLTCGILALFYVNPYIYQTYAELFHSLRGPGYGGGNVIMNGPSGFNNDPRYGFNPDQPVQPAQPAGYYDPATGERVSVTPQQPQNQGYYDPNAGGQGYYDPNQQMNQGYYDPNQQNMNQGYYDPNQGGGYNPNNPY